MGKILAADDNPEIRNYLGVLLSREHDVTFAEDGEMAIELLESEPFDAVILDVEMPRTDGWEALRVLKDPDNGWPDTKVIMLTCMKEPEHFLKSIVVGADYFVSKPFDPQQLLETLDRALEPSAS